MFLLLLPLLFFSSFVKASDTLVLKDKTEKFCLTGQKLAILQDTFSTFTIDDIRGDYAGHFRSNWMEIPKNSNTHSTYWLRFFITDQRKQKQPLLFELFDFRIDNYTVYFPIGKGKFLVKEGGDLYPFSYKEFKHKNFIHQLPPLPAGVSTGYIRIQSVEPVGMIAEIRTLPFFTHYATTEYLCLALFYGIIAAIAIYNIFLFFSIQEFVYLYYVLYILSIGLYCLTQDGLGFQYLWPGHPGINKYAFPVALYMMVVWCLLYARLFLNTQKSIPIFDWGIWVFLAIRTVIFLAALTIAPELEYAIWLDIIPLFFIFMAGIVRWLQGYKAARFYILAFSALFLGFAFSAFSYVTSTNSIFSVYVFNFGVLGEIFLFSFALADRIKLLMKENNSIYRQMIFQLEEKKQLKEKINKELEEKVHERTKELEEKNHQLDAFVYKASHDLKGPLHSIIGLTNVGIKDVSEEKAKIYLEHISKSTKRLDATLSDLLNFTKVKKVLLTKEKIDFKEMVNDILGSFSNLPEYSKMRFEVSISQPFPFYGDTKLLYSILQNFIENAIKYRDGAKSESYLKIQIATKENGATLLFEDNGLGMSKEQSTKIFEMFYKVNENSLGTGLGLYLVKMAVEKLGGTIKVFSEQDKGTTFIVEFVENKSKALKN